MPETPTRYQFSDLEFSKPGSIMLSLMNEPEDSHAPKDLQDEDDGDGLIERKINRGIFG